MSDKDSQDREAVAVVARDLVERTLDHGSAPEDEKVLLEWRDRDPRHAEALADAVRLHGRLLDARDTLRCDPDTLAMLASARMHQQVAILPVTMQRGIGRRAFLGGAIAASAAGYMAIRPPLDLWPSLAELGADYRTGTGERRMVQIASGFAVELNTRTALARRDDSQAYRLKLISGEVAVDARRLAQLAVIESEQGQASTRDGQFSARLQDDGGMCVTCFAGEVAIADRQRAETRLVRGQQIVLGGRDAKNIVAVDPNVAEAWRRGELIFNNRPLSEVVAEINRYRPGQIILTNSEVASRTVSAVFRLDRLGSAASQIQIVSGASVRSLPGGVVLLG